MPFTKTLVPVTTGPDTPFQNQYYWSIVVLTVILSVIVLAFLIWLLLRAYKRLFLHVETDNFNLTLNLETGTEQNDDKMGNDLTHFKIVDLKTKIRVHSYPF